MHRVPAREHEQRSRGHRQDGERIAVAGEHTRDVVVALVVGVADERRDLEVAALVGVLQRERDDEVGLVEVPLQLVAVAHDREVQRAERIGVRIDRVEAEDRGDERPQLVPLEQLPYRRVGREEVVRHRADAVVAEPLARVIERERLVGKAQIHGAEAAAAVRERRQPPRVLDERVERFGADESGDLAGPGGLHLHAPGLDHRPVEIDDRDADRPQARPRV